MLFSTNCWKPRRQAKFSKLSRSIFFFLFFLPEDLTNISEQNSSSPAMNEHIEEGDEREERYEHPV